MWWIATYFFNKLEDVVGNIMFLLYLAAIAFLGLFFILLLLAIFTNIGA